MWRLAVNNRWINHFFLSRWRTIFFYITWKTMNYLFLCLNDTFSIFFISFLSCLSPRNCFVKIGFISFCIIPFNLVYFVSIYYVSVNFVSFLWISFRFGIFCFTVYRYPHFIRRKQSSVFFHLFSSPIGTTNWKWLNNCLKRM